VTSQQAKELARRIVEADEDGESIVKVVIRYMMLTGWEATDRYPLLERAFLILAELIASQEQGRKP